MDDKIDIPTLSQISIKASKEAKQNFRDVFINVAEKHGLSAEALVQTIINGLTATSVKAQYDKDSTEFVYSKEMADHPTRLSAVRIAGEFMGLKAADKVEHSGLNGGPIEYTRLDRANRLAAILEAAKARKSGSEDDEDK